MNGSFESPSHLERRIRAEIEDFEESSLSAPGFGRRARSESLSFRTDEGSDEGGRTTSYHPSTHRILPDLSELNATPTAATRTRTSQTLAGVLDRQRQQNRTDVSEERSQQRTSRRQQQDSFNASARQDASASRRQLAHSGGSTSESGSFNGGRNAGPRDSLPLTSTPQKTGYTHRSQTTFYSQKSGAEAGVTGRQGAGATATLARRAAEGAATRESTRQTSSDRRASRRQDDDASDSAWSSGSREGSRQPSVQEDLSVGTINSVDQERPAAPRHEDGESSRGETTRVSDAETSAQPTEGMEPPPPPANYDDEPTEAMTEEDQSQRTPTRPLQTNLATPRANAAVTADRMQSYVLSAFKDPVRDLRVQQSLRAQRIRPQRVPLVPSQESSLTEATPATERRMDRVGRAMKLGAGRTPLPTRGRQSDAASQASEQSSTYDLMTPAKGWANTSLPGIGLQAADNASQATNRIDPNKLSRHLHKLNGGLVEENAELKAAAASAQHEVETLRRQLNVALREKEKAQRQLAEQSRDGEERSPADIPLPPSPSPGDAAEHEEREQALQEALEKIEELEGHKEELNDMLDALESEHENLRAELEQAKQRRAPAARSAAGGDETGEHTQGSAAISERDVLLNDLEADLKRCEEEIQVRGEKLQQAHEQLQASEEHRARLQAEVEEAANFAMQETGKFEEERDAAIAQAEDYKGEVKRLTQQVEKLEMAAQAMRAERKSQGRSGDDEEEVERLRQELEEARATHADEKAELEDHLKAHEMDLQAMEDERKEVDDDIRKLTTEAEELRDELDRQHIAVEEKQNEILKLNRLLSSSGDAAKELADVREQLSRAKAASSESRAQALEVEQLKKQKQDLEGRLDSYKQQVQAHSSFSAMAAAAHQSQTSSVLQTPAAKHRALTNLQTPIRTPKSPGQLSSASWLNHESSLGNTSVVEHIKQLEELLAAANAQLDEKLSEIDRQGVSHLTLSKKLFEALDRVEELEAELRRLQGKDEELEAVSRKLSKIQCTSCKVRFDASHQVRVSRAARSGDDPFSGAADATFTSSSTINVDRKARSMQREQALAEFVEKMPQLTRRLAEMEEENRVLRSAQSNANKAASAAGTKTKPKTTTSAASRKAIQTSAHAELDRARAAIADLDAELREERRRLASLARDSKSYGDVSTTAERDLARTELRLRTIESELQRKAADYAELQQEVADKSSLSFGDATVGGEVAIQLRILESQARQAAKELEHLREDRKAVLEARRELHAKVREANERHSTVQAELAATRLAAQEHQAQLEVQTRQLEELHAELRRQDRDLKKMAGDRERLAEERVEIMQDVAALEGDLRRVRGESERFGADLERLRREREEQRRRGEAAGSNAAGAAAAREGSSLASVTAEAQETIASLKRRLDYAQRMIQDLEVRESLAATVGPGQHAHQDAVALRAKHTAECKSLLTQIRYLKAKFMRESDLREDLCFQKRYLLQMVGGLELTEKETLRFLCDVGKSRGVDVASARKATGKTTAQAKLRKALVVVHAASRMKIMAQNWRQTVAVKQALVDAHQEAKKRRAQNGGGSSSDREGGEGFAAKLAAAAAR